MTTANLTELERRLWAAAAELRANSTLTAAQYRDPVLGLIFLAFAEHRFEEPRPELEAKATGRQTVTPECYCGGERRSARLRRFSMAAARRARSAGVELSSSLLRCSAHVARSTSVISRITRRPDETCSRTCSSFASRVS